MSFTKEEIGAIIKKTRLQAKFTQKELADKLGRKQQVIGHWETGYAQPDANTLFELFDILKVSIDDAFGFKNKKTLTMSEATNFSLSKKEKNVVTAYRNNPPMQDAVDKLLGLEEKTVHIYRAAKSNNNASDEILDVPAERIQRLRDAPETDDKL